MATIANLERDALRSEVENVRHDADWVRRENQRLWQVVAAAEALFQSRTWSNSSLSESDAGPVTRVRNALGVCRRATQENGHTAPVGVVWRIEDPRLK